MSSASSSLRPRIVLQDPVDPVEALRGTRILAASFSSPAEFLHAYQDSEPAGELALVTRARPATGTEVVVEVSWPELPNPVFLRARVQRRRLGLIAYIHPDDAAARDFLVQMAAGDAVRYHVRQHRRYCVRFPVEWRIFGSTTHHSGEAEDLSSGGIMIATCAPPPPLGERVGLRLKGEHLGQDLVVTGDIRYSRLRERDGAFGVRFAYRSSGENRRVRQLLRAFAARGLVLIR